MPALLGTLGGLLAEVAAERLTPARSARCRRRSPRPWCECVAPLSRRRRRPAALCAEGGGPEVLAEAAVGACLAEAAACGTAALVRFGGPLKGRRAEFAKAVACARDRASAG